MKNVFFILAFVLTMFVAQATEISIDPPTDLTAVSFNDAKYDEARATYDTLRSIPSDEAIVVSDAESWKEYELFMIESHWSEITSSTSVDLYTQWIPELNRHVGVQIGMTYSFADGCAGMNCCYGCCSITFNYNIGGTFTAYHCCDCVDEQ